MGAQYTAKRLPVKLVYCEFYDRVADAFYREKQIQGWSRRKKEALIKGDDGQLHQLAECRNESHYVWAGFDSAGFDSADFDSAQPTEPKPTELGECVDDF